MCQRFIINNTAALHVIRCPDSTVTTFWIQSKHLAILKASHYFCTLARTVLQWRRSTGYFSWITSPDTSQKQQWCEPKLPLSQEVRSPCWPWSHLASHPSFASPSCAGAPQRLCFLGPCQQASARGQEETRVVEREEGEAFSLLASGPFFGSDRVPSVAPASHRSTGVPTSVGWPWPLGSEEPLSL